MLRGIPHRTGSEPYPIAPVWCYTGAMMKIGTGIGDFAGAPAGVDGLVAQARRAEADGFASGWFANIMGMDAIMAAALCARATPRIELRTALMATLPRPPPPTAPEAPPAQALAGRPVTRG